MTVLSITTFAQGTVTIDIMCQVQGMDASETVSNIVEKYGSGLNLLSGTAGSVECANGDRISLTVSCVDQYRVGVLTVSQLHKKGPDTKATRLFHLRDADNNPKPCIEQQSQ